MANTITIKYFAMLEEQVGKAEEQRTETLASPLEWYQFLAKEYKFAVSIANIRPAINNKYCKWDERVEAGDTLAFIPPVAGG